MASAFAAGFFGRLAEISAEERQAEREREARLEALMYQRYTSVLPYLMERKQKIDEIAKAEAAARVKGIRLFGEKVTNTLENMGELQGVVAQYDSTENSAEWASTIVARTESFLEKMLNSDDEAEKAAAINLMKKGSYYTNASVGEQTDFLSEFLATGTFSGNFSDMDLGSAGGTSYAGPVPSFGKAEALTSAQLSSEAMDLAVSLIPGSSVQEVDGKKKIIAPKGIDTRFIQASANRLATEIEKLTTEEGLTAAEARKSVFDRYNSVDGFETFKTEIYSDLGIDYNPANVEDAVQPTTATPMELQEAMQDVVQPQPTNEPIVVPELNTWDPSAFDEDEEDQYGR
jgi:hypothetical protein